MTLGRIHLLFVAMALSGCFHASALRTGPLLPPGADDAPVQVFDTPPQQPYTEVGRLEMQVPAGVRENRVLEKFQVAARQLGADAIVLGQERTISTEVTRDANGTTTSRMTERTATAIVLTSPVVEPSSAPSAPPLVSSN